ncbi:MAG: hypothetical protein M1831_006156 [Alyxoria varia]|nr:MAG: hypothetical protein M1831_006156 [Alyxoria varia]
MASTPPPSITPEPTTPTPQAPRPTARVNTDDFFSSLESYPWSTDTEFQSGLAAILGPAPAPSDSAQTRDLTLRARCFYYARVFGLGEPVDFSAYSQWRERQPQSALSSLERGQERQQRDLFFSADTPHQKTLTAATVNGGEINHANAQGVASSLEPNESERLASVHEVPHPQDFLSVARMIQRGERPPNVEEVPNIVLENQITEPTMAPRPKPWERSTAQ